MSRLLNGLKLFLAASVLVLSLKTWFSATAIAPELTADFALTADEAAWVTNALQAEFVIKALTSNFRSLADISPLFRVMALTSVMAG